MGSLQDLPDDAGWWGYSMRDVPSRPKGETFIATIPDATVVTCIDGEGEFYPAILTKDGKSLEMREIRFRNLHAEHMRSSPPVRRLAQATWVCERVYDNHSHWLSAHLPKLSLLTREGRSASILLPEKLTGTMQASLEMLGLDPADHQRFRPGEVLKVGTLTVVGTDRFRGELLRPVRERMTASAQGRGKGRRIYISRRKAKVRRLVNEDEVWPLFEAAGFQRYDMEDVSFVSQVEMMAEAEALAAPHGAGLTNMIFCPSGTHVFEMAWLGFPNPNFYALACAMGHRYGIVGTRPVGGGPENFRDMEVDADAVRHGLAEMCRSMDAA
ncbi:glycosyltransferase family 61 protein [Novosphingobium marinum]|uniref:glycosyltransferase family 61 protein n=1 Tax=Novosphingobium marinum TaxID=1514948 RepID=UPI001665F870|nr:glycosyltransferase family 61 protein [Novosphingobium marinum]